MQSRLAAAVVVGSLLATAASVLAEVSRQVTGPRVLLLADRALVRSLTGMRHHVLAQVARRRVPVAARRARVRRLVRVDVHVPLDGARLREPLLTDAALIPALPGVYLQTTPRHLSHGFLSL